MIAKNHEPKPLELQVVNDDQPEHEDLGEDIKEESTTANVQQGF